MNGPKEEQKSLKKISEDDFDSPVAENFAGAWLESLTDSMLTDGLLKELPFFSLAFSGIRTYNALSDYLLMGKIEHFRHQLRNKNIPDSKREAFVNRCKTDEAYSRRVGLNLLLKIEKHSDVEKSEMVGRIFCAQVTGEIDDHQFDALVAAVEKLDIHHIETLRDWYESDKSHSGGNDIPLQSLAIAGLISMYSGADAIFGPNDLGKLFLKVALEEISSAESGQE